MVQWQKDRWVGNQWASIAITPESERYFFLILEHLSHRYGFPMPRIIDLIDGYAAEFLIDGTHAILDIDAYTFSIAFVGDNVRDRVFADLQTLPDDYFETIQ